MKNAPLSNRNLSNRNLPNRNLPNRNLSSSTKLHARRWFVASAVSILLVGVLAGCVGAGRHATWTADFEDGTYLAISEYTQDDGTAPYLAITIDDGVISGARLRFVDAEGTEQPDHPEQSAAREVAERIIGEQKIPGTISGPLGTWLPPLAEAVAARSRAGDTRPALVTFGGVYRAQETGTDQIDGASREWIATIALTYEQQTLAEVTFEEVWPEVGDHHSEWRDATGIDLRHVYERLDEQLRHEGRASGVDIVSGATRTSRRFRTLAQTAMEKRVPVDFVALRATLAD